MHRASLILLVYTGEALAHPDHGAAGWLSATLAHLLSEPDHVAMIAAPVAAVLVWIGRLVARRSRALSRSRQRSSRV